MEFLAATAAGSCGMFCGSALYVTAVQEPAGNELDVDAHHAYWVPMFHKAKALNGGLAVLSSLSAAGCAVGSTCPMHRAVWGTAAAGMGLMWPYTLKVMWPTNKALLEGNGESDAVKKSLLAKWASMHAVRTGTSLVCFSLILFILSRKRAPRSLHMKL